MHKESILEIVNQHDKFLISGASASGKSLLTYILLYYYSLLSKNKVIFLTDEPTQLMSFLFNFVKKQRLEMYGYFDIAINIDSLERMQIDKEEDVIIFVDTIKNISDILLKIKRKFKIKKLFMTVNIFISRKLLNDNNFYVIESKKETSSNKLDMCYKLSQDNTLTFNEVVNQIKVGIRKNKINRLI